MSVVTRWRSTFSSSVTHFTVMSGFLAVKSLVSPCMRIMSPLFTVAMVSVSAIAGTDIDRMAAPRRAPNDGFTVSSQGSRWAYAHALGVCSDQAVTLSRVGWLALEDRAGGRFVGYEAVQQAALQRRPDRRDLGRTDGGADGQAAGGNLQGDAGEPVVGSAVDDAALGIEYPADQLADGAQASHL